MKTTLQRYGITKKELARMFGYKHENSLYASSARDRILKGIEQLILTVEQRMIEKMKQ